MRVRLYKIGQTKSVDIFRIDRFPALLSLDDQGRLQTDVPPSRLPACLLEDIGGQILVHAEDSAATVGINDASIESGPLLPGDHLRLGEQRYLVSYERTASEHPPFMRVRV